MFLQWNLLKKGVRNLNNQKIIIVSNGKNTSILVNGKLYGDHITKVSFSHKKKKTGKDDVRLLFTSDTVPVPEMGEKEMDNFIEVLKDYLKK